MKTQNSLLAALLMCLISSPAWATPIPGELVGWGWNDNGQTTVPAGNDFVDVAAGADHGLAMKTDGSLVAWGRDTEGQVTNVPAGNDFAAIAAGDFHNLALKSDGSLISWGYNTFGQTNVSAGNDFVAVAAGNNFSLALKSDGSLVAWGRNLEGQTNVPAGNDFVAIAAGGGFGLAQKSDGSLAGWGWNLGGPTNVPAGNDFVAFAAGEYNGLALKSDGSLVGWGSNNEGQTNVPAGNDFVAIAPGWYNGLALKSDGSLVAWGVNYYGETDVPAGNDFVAIAGGQWHGLAIQAPEIIPVVIDIKPGSDRNPINLKSNGVLPVAILSTSMLDAKQVDISTLLFGDPLLIADGKSPVSPLRGNYEDVNYDGLADLTLKFSMQDLLMNEVIGTATVQGHLAGKLLNGKAITGGDMVTIVPALQSMSIPEPSSLLLILLGALALTICRRS
jgi:hypothetical protein